MKIFISCSKAEEDRELLSRLTKQLYLAEQDNILRIWHEGKIAPGQTIEEEIELEIKTSQIFVLLLSADFFSDKFGEMKKILKRIKNGNDDDTRVIPILWRPYDYKGLKISEFKSWPRDGEFLSLRTRQQQEKVLSEIAESLKFFAEAIAKNDHSKEFCSEEHNSQDQGLATIAKIPEENLVIVKPRKISFWNLLSLYWKLILYLLAPCFVIFIRTLGYMQDMELSAYDQFFEQKLPGPQDSRLVVITISQEDIDAQRSRQETFSHNVLSISNQSLKTLIDKLNEADPVAIGLDIYLESVDFESLLDNKPTDLLFPICRHSLFSIDKKTGGIEGEAPPNGIVPQNVGYVDFVGDSLDVVRRYLLASPVPAGSKCTSDFSFAFQIVKEYLRLKDQSLVMPTEHSKLCDSKKKPFSDGKFRISFVSRFFGGYQNLFPNDVAGCQILINYDPIGIGIAEAISLESALKFSEEDARDRLQGKIVLIGVIHNNDERDFHFTTYSKNHDERLPGVFIHAQVISQLLNEHSGSKGMIRTWNILSDSVLIYAWGITGLAMAFFICKFSNNYELVRQHKPLILLSLLIVWAGSISVVYYISFFAFIGFSLWLPMTPSIISFSTLYLFRLLLEGTRAE